jgi:hypothetical protein
MKVQRALTPGRIGGHRWVACALDRGPRRAGQPVGGGCAEVVAGGGDQHGKQELMPGVDEVREGDLGAQRQHRGGSKAPGEETGVRCDHVPFREGAGLSKRAGR